MDDIGGGFPTTLDSPELGSATLSDSGFLADILGTSEHRGCSSPPTCKVSGSACRSDGGPDGGESCSRMKVRRKWLKNKGKGANYTLGEDIGFNQILEMTKLTPVGRAYGRSFALKSVVGWAKNNWLGQLGYVSEVVALYRNWFAFHFTQEDHALWVLSRNWNLDHAPFFLKHWDPLFNASWEREYAIIRRPLKPEGDERTDCMEKREKYTKFERKGHHYTEECASETQNTFIQNMVCSGNLPQQTNEQANKVLSPVCEFSHHFLKYFTKFLVFHKVFSFSQSVLMWDYEISCSGFNAQFVCIELVVVDLMLLLQYR